MVLTTYTWTHQKYHQAIEQGLFNDEPVELLRGDLVVMTPEGESHAYYNTEIADYLRLKLGSKAKIRDAKPVTLPNNSEPEPDIAVVQNLGQEYLHHHPYPENIFLIIEISKTTLNKDLGEKKIIYAEAGIREYWVVDLQNSQLQVFRLLKDGQYCEALALSTGTVSPCAFPEITLNIKRILSGHLD
ncbi:Uma2 family endonuclease [Prochlorothrix hollandica]|uniref:Uma2 family endonuclease n=1 Tax=Prochlorothrix hollandica TaxID=1223 RepID=UPI0033405A9E